MSQITLNIGLASNDGAPQNPNAFGRAIAAAAVRFYCTSLQAELQQSNTEQTAVITLTTSLQGDKIEGAVISICQLLNQDAIALTIDGKGELYGPKAENWGGKFLQEYFLKPRPPGSAEAN